MSDAKLPRVPKNHPYVHRVVLDLDEKQGVNLLKGKAIKLHPSKLLPPVGHPSAITVNVHPDQLVAIAKGLMNSKAVSFKMDPVQIALHVRSKGKKGSGVEGAGFFSNLWKKIKSAGKAVYKNVIKPVGKVALSIPGVKPVLDKAIDAGSQAVQGVVGEVAGSKVGNVVGDALRSGAQKVVSDIGSGVKKGRGGRKSLKSAVGGAIVNLHA